MTGVQECLLSCNFPGILTGVSLSCECSHMSTTLYLSSKSPVVMQCDCWAHSIHLRVEGPSHGCGHSLLLFSGHPACGTEQPASWALHHSQQQWRQLAAHTPYACHVSGGRHAVTSRQVSVTFPMFVKSTFCHMCMHLDGALHHRQQQSRQVAAVASHARHVSIGRHAVTSWQVGCDSLHAS